MVVVAMVCCEVFFTDELSLARCSFVRSCRKRASDVVFATGFARELINGVSL